MALEHALSRSPAARSAPAMGAELTPDVGPNRDGARGTTTSTEGPSGDGGARPQSARTAPPFRLHAQPLEHARDPLEEEREAPRPPRHRPPPADHAMEQLSPARGRREEGPASAAAPAASAMATGPPPARGRREEEKKP
ncbi:unnamed protein product [Urochloa humidicola]